MQVLVDPPMPQWLPAAPTTARSAGRASPPATLATGHQAWLWHPGILAKDLAMAAAARAWGAQTFHLVVDHDVHEALALELPVREGDRLSALRIRLASENLELPSGCQPPFDPAVAIATLESTRKRLGTSLLVDPGPLLDALAKLPRGHDSLAHQMAELTARLMRPLIGEIPMRLATGLADMPPFEPLVRDMLKSAPACVRAYNQAVAQHPEARVAPLGVELERVELPLWAIAFDRPRQRVFADLSDSRRIDLTLQDGQAFDPFTPGRSPLRLAPRAILMSAFLRRWCCDLFIHGKGGAIYDRITEAWWQAWRGESLAPKAVVSADLRLSFDVPLADAPARDRAVWRAHHLRHNLDRALPPGPDGDAARVARKHQLLACMGLDRDRDRRAAVFAEIHQINDALARDHAGLLEQARAQARAAQAGLANRAVALRRDWCFALYPPDRLLALRDALAMPGLSSSP